MRLYGSCYLFILAQIYPLLSVVLLSLFLGSLSTPIDQDIDHVHASLAAFLLRGQLVVETFAPFSFLLRNTCRGSCPHVLLSWSLCMAGISVFNALERAIVFADDSLKQKKFLRISGIFIAPCLVCFTIPYVEGDISSTFTLKRARDVADCLLIMSVAISFCRQRTALLVSEVLLFIGLLLGCDPLDFLLCFLNVQFQRAIRAFKKISDINIHLSRILWRLLWEYVRTALVGITLITVAVYMVYPWSETSAGGNYNLHFLSPEMRRALRPAISQEYVSTTDNLIKRNGGKDHFLRQNEPLSIYMPAVGFLWTDDMVWDEEIGIFVEESFAKQQEMQNIASKGVSSDSLADFPGRRAIFKDHINSVGPWVFSRVLSENDDRFTSGSFILDGDLIHLRDYRSGRYLQAEEGVQNIIDHESGRLLDPKEAHQKFRVSVFPEIRNSSVWVLFYDRKKGNGFQLYNPIVQCFLSSTFRSFPDYNGERVNDTMIHQLRLELDTTCSTNPKHTASTLFAIDGYPKSIPRINSFVAYSSVEQAWRYTRALLQAMYSLHNFRSRYAYYQDMPMTLLGLSRLENPEYVELCRKSIVFLFLAVASIRFLVLQRGPKVARQMTSQQNSFLYNGSDTWTKYFGGFAIVLCHLIWYDILGHIEVHGPRVIIVIAFLSLIEIMTEIKLIQCLLCVKTCIMGKED